MPSEAPTILVADDEELMRLSMSATLTKAGYGVELAVDGKETVRKALELHPSLIIMDYQMPELDGISAIREIRADKWGADVPIILATNIYESDLLSAVLQLGVKDYILKSSTTPDGILAQVRKYLLL